MDTKDSQVLPLTAAYEFAVEHRLKDEVEKIRNMEIEWDLSYTSSLRRGYIVDLFQQKGIFEQFVQGHWPNGATKDGQTLVRRYLRIKGNYESFLAGNEVDGGEEPEDWAEQAFAAEADLRDFLAQNLEIIEPGLRLYKEGERDGVEYPVDSGRMDILALDRQGKFVVIELKLSQGRNKAIGQILYYMGWVDKNLGRGPCRGVIVARDISDEMRTTASRVTGLSLFRYHLKVSVEKVS